MAFTMLGMVSAMSFGVCFGSEGELPPELQDSIFIWADRLRCNPAYATDRSREDLREPPLSSLPSWRPDLNEWYKP